MYYLSIGDSGKRCEFLTSVSFAQNGSYIEMPSLKTKPEANITMIFSTEEENGILVYNGESQHIAVELFRGRIRVSYDVGNYPVSNMFRSVVLSVVSMSNRVRISTNRISL